MCENGVFGCGVGRGGKKPCRFGGGVLRLWNVGCGRWNVGCEMSDYKDIMWNSSSIHRSGLNKKQSLNVAERIKELYERFY